MIIAGTVLLDFIPAIFVVVVVATCQENLLIC